MKEEYTTKDYIIGFIALFVLIIAITIVVPMILGFGVAVIKSAYQAGAGCYWW